MNVRETLDLALTVFEVAVISFLTTATIMYTFFRGI
jgi:hypothetical protein